MSELTFNKEKCAQRNRIAARRDGVNAVVVKFLRGDVGLSARLLSADGEIPANDERALELINVQQAKRGAPELTADQVYIHYIEAASDNFIGDRFAFMSESTLRNIATEARSGFAFMNSHRTGGLSTPAELPFGRTFAGRFEMYDDPNGPRRRAVVGFYMLAGIHPNGEAGGPSTDDLHKMIDGGQLFDVSVSLWGGMAMCDLCGQDLRARSDDGAYLCAHAPGTHRGMSAEQIAAQKGRGVTDGKASYTLHDCHCSEVSAVYDGAVPGAGFQKAIAFARDMSPAEWKQVQESFASLFGGVDKEIEIMSALEINQDEKPDSFLGRLGRFLSERFGGDDGAPKDDADLAAKRAALDAEAAELQAKADRLQAQAAELQTRLSAEQKSAAEERIARIDTEVKSFIKDNDSRMGASLRTTVEALYRGAKLGVVSLRREKPGAAADATEAERFEVLTATLSAEASAIVVATVESFVKSLPPVGTPERIDAGGKTVDDEVAKVTGDLKIDADAELDKKVTARQKADGVSYEIALSRVKAEAKRAA